MTQPKAHPEMLVLLRGYIAQIKARLNEMDLGLDEELTESQADLFMGRLSTMSQNIQYCLNDMRPTYR